MRARAVAVGLLVLAACDEPAPLKPAATSQAIADPTGAIPKLEPLAPAAIERNEAAVAPEITKRLRAELCLYGLYGAIYARDAYWESLGKNPPGAQHLPSFGVYDEHRVSAGSGRVPIAAKMGRLPFERHLRACAAAMRLAEGKWPELDAALAKTEPHATAAARILSQAARYYAREEYDGDGFAQGNESHEQISDALGKLDDAQRAYAGAVSTWMGSTKPADDDQRDALGKQSAEIVTLARAATTGALATERNEEALSQALSGLKKQRKALEEAGPQAKLLARLVDALVGTLEKPPGELTAKERYEIAMRFTSVLEADHRIATRGHPSGRDPRALDDERLRARIPPK